MQKLNLPDYNFRISKNNEDKLLIFDPLRKKNIILTPEEWVRQNFIRYLIEEKQFPQTLISLESGIKLNKLARRYDALVYNRNGEPLLLIECKAPSVKIDQKTFDQITAYNLTLKAQYLLVTNGLKHFACKLDMNLHKYIFMEEIPEYDSL